MAIRKFRMTAWWIPVGNYPYKVKSFRPWNAWFVELGDSRKSTFGKPILKKAKRK